jgi:hypothetical protein
MSDQEIGAIWPRFAFCPRLFRPACDRLSRFTGPIFRSGTISAELSWFAYRCARATPWKIIVFDAGKEYVGLVFESVSFVEALRNKDLWGIRDILEN